MITNLEENLYQTISKGEGHRLRDMLSTVDKDSLTALGIYGESEFCRNEEGYTVITFITKPQVTQKGAVYEIDGTQGFLIKVPDDLEKPFKMRILPETPVVVAEGNKVFLIFEPGYGLKTAVQTAQKDLTAFEKQG